jgi:hypothetical protein
VVLKEVNDLVGSVIKDDVGAHLDHRFPPLGRRQDADAALEPFHRRLLQAG